MAASERLSHLLQLADRGPALRAALAEEVAELLAAWPADYPDSMRGACEALLAKASLDVDETTRARLRAHLSGDPGLVQRVLPQKTNAISLVAAARNGEDLTTVLAQSLGVQEAMARQILADDSGAALAVACKGAHIERAAFSALALLTRARRDRAHAFAVLDTFDNVPASEAVSALDGWRHTHAA